MVYQELFKESLLKRIKEEYEDKDFLGVKNTIKFLPEELKTPEICLESVKIDGKDLQYVPEELKTPEICLEAVKDDGRALKYVPERLKTPELCIEAVKNDGSVIEYVPKELYLEVLKYKESAFEYIPEKVKTLEIYLEVVKNNGRALKYVPERLKSLEMCLDAVKNDGRAIEYVPERLKSLEMCLDAVKNDGNALQYVPKKLKTLKMCLEAVKNEGSVLSYVPERLKTPEICLEAVKNCGKALKYVPQELKTLEICLEAVKNEGSVLSYVPERLKTPEICLEAVKNMGYSLEYVPEELKTPEICLEAIKNYGQALQYVPEKLKNSEICLEAVKNNGERFQEFKNYGTSFQYVPEKLKTSEICLEAVKDDGEDLQYVPEKLKSPEICLEAVKNDGNALQYVPEKLKTLEMCLEAVKNDGNTLQYVPEKLKTLEMCLEAVNNTGYAINYVPKEMRTLEIYIVLAAKTDEIDLNEIMKIAKRADKFNEICHFVPSLEVLSKYPIDQIEKFNKKIWFNLARYKLYNQNSNAKSALVEIALSFGIFDRDDKQLERIGIIQKMATYIPKEELLLVPELDEFTQENFEIVGRERVTSYHLNRERLLSDPNIINLFGDKEQVEEEIEKLAEIISLEDLEYIINEVLTNENTSDNYKRVRAYFYKVGYDKVEEEKGYIVKLKKDIQQEKLRDKKKGKELEDKIRQFYYSHGSKLIMTPDKLHRIFDGMDMRYKPGVYEFFRKNYERIVADEKKQSELSKIQKQWNNIVEAYLGQKIDFEKCELYISNQQYENIGENELEIAKLASTCGYSQSEFEIVKKIFETQIKRTQSSIPQIEKKDEKTGYTYKVLRLDDPTAIFVGELTDCCQALGKAGESCMMHSVISTNGRVLVVQDEKGKVLSQSWIWRNKNTICFDNIEAIEKDSNNKKIISSDLLSVIQEAARDFVETDKIGMQKWKKEQLSKLEEEKENGSITEHEYKQERERIESIVESQQLTKVTVGIGYTDVDLSGLKYDDENKYPEEKVDYIDDSRTQLILYEDRSIKHVKHNGKTVARYSDDEKSTMLINVDTSEVEHSNDDDEYDDDEYDDDGNNKINLCDIENVIRYAERREEARKALENIEKYLEENGIEI